MMENEKVAGRRATLSPQELHEVLSRAFDRIRPPQCRTCAMPAPFRAAKPDYDAANWAIPLTARCEHDCVNFMRWLWAQYGRIYDIAEE